MKPAIAFDLDGTLVDVSKRDYKIYEDIVKELGGRPISFNDYWPKRQARTNIHTILSQSGIVNKKEVVYFLSERKIRMERIDYLSLDKLFADVKETLDELSNNHEIFILTIRHNKENTYRQLNLLGLDRYHIIIVEGGKEDALKRIPNLQAMIGDTENDIVPAVKINVQSIAVTTGIRNENLLKSMNPTNIVKSLKEVKLCLQ